MPIPRCGTSSATARQPTSSRRRSDARAVEHRRGLRAANGCTDTDANAADFATGAPNPRNSAASLNACGPIGNLPVAASCPPTLTSILGAGASVPLSATDPDGIVTSAAIVGTPLSGIALGAFAPVPATGRAGVTTLIAASSLPAGSYEVQVSFVNADAVPESAACTVRVAVTTAIPSARIRDLQGAGHLSPLAGQTVTNVPGIVTAARTNGFFMQDPAPDSDPATSEAIFVFTSATPAVTVGDAVVVSGTVTEFRPGGADGTNNLTITEIVIPTALVLSTGNALPAPIVIGVGGRVPPTEIINGRGAAASNRRRARSIRTRTASISTRAWRPCAYRSTTPSRSVRRARSGRSR